MSSADDRQDPLRNPEGGSESAGRDPWSAPPEPTTGAWSGTEQGGYGQIGPAGAWPGTEQGGYGQIGPAGLPQGQQPPGYGPQSPYGSSPYDQVIPGAPGYGPSAYGPGGYGPGGYGPAGYGPGYYPAPRPTNGMAVASMVLGILWLYWIGSILALIFGYVAKRQILERGESGGGMAAAGIVLGWIGVGFLTLGIAFAVIAGIAGSVW